MNKILIDNNIKSFRLFPGSVPKKCKLIRKDKVKEFVKSLMEELTIIKTNLNKKNTREILNDFKKKYFMINEVDNILEYDFFNDEIIHQKLLNFGEVKNNIEKLDIIHEIEVMENILKCYDTRCSLTVDYSNMKFLKSEKKQMLKVLEEYKNSFSKLKEKALNLENIENESKNIISEIKCILNLSSKIVSNTPALLYGNILLNNISRLFLNIFYGENNDMLEYENKFFMCNVKKTDYFQELINDSKENIEKIMNQFREVCPTYLEKYPDFSELKLELIEAIDKMEFASNI